MKWTKITEKIPAKGQKIVRYIIKDAPFLPPSLRIEQWDMDEELWKSCIKDCVKVPGEKHYWAPVEDFDFPEV